MSIEVERGETHGYLPWVRIANRKQWLHEHTELVDRYRRLVGPSLDTCAAERWASPKAIEYPCLWHHELHADSFGKTRLNYFFVFTGDARRLFTS